MGDGLKRAVLATLKTQGPWTGDHLYASQWTLTGDELAAYYAAIKARATTPSLALGPEAVFSSKTPRANRLLKKAKLIQYNRIDGTWEAT